MVPSPDPLRLAVPKCFVSLKAGYAATPELAADIFAHLRQRLAPYERIRRLEFADIPKTLSGKIRRADLRRLEAKRRAASEKGELEFVEDETASEEQYRAIFNVSVDAINLWDPDTHMIDANPAYFEMYGYVARGGDRQVYSLWAAPRTRGCAARTHTPYPRGRVVSDRDDGHPQERRAPRRRGADNPRALSRRDACDHRHEGHQRAHGCRGRARCVWKRSCGKPRRWRR